MNQDKTKKRWHLTFYFADDDKFLTIVSQRVTKPMTKADFKAKLPTWIEKEKPHMISVETKGFYEPAK